MRVVEDSEEEMREKNDHGLTRGFVKYKNTTHECDDGVTLVG